MASPSARLRKARTSRQRVLARHSAITVLATGSRLIVSDLSVSDRIVSGIVILIGIVSYLLYSLSQWFKYIADMFILSSSSEDSKRYKTSIDK